MGDFTTGTDGKITVDNLPEGAYRFCEITPHRMAMDPSPPRRLLTVSASRSPDRYCDRQSRPPIELTFQNYPIPPASSRQLTKRQMALARIIILANLTTTNSDSPIPENVGTFSYYRVVDSFPMAVDYIAPWYSVAPCHSSSPPGRLGFVHPPLRSCRSRQQPQTHHQL